jgi:hypothetical protein
MRDCDGTTERPRPFSPLSTARRPTKKSLDRASIIYINSFLTMFPHHPPPPRIHSWARLITILVRGSATAAEYAVTVRRTLAHDHTATTRSPPRSCFASVCASPGSLSCMHGCVWWRCAHPHHVPTPTVPYYCSREIAKCNDEQRFLISLYHLATHFSFMSQNLQSYNSQRLCPPRL